MTLSNSIDRTVPPRAVAHSSREARYFAFGRTDGGRLLTVVFTVRGQLLRVISARPMSRRERRGYAQATRP